MCELSDVTTIGAGIAAMLGLATYFHAYQGKKQDSTYDILSRIDSMDRTPLNICYQLIQSFDSTTEQDLKCEEVVTLAQALKYKFESSPIQDQLTKLDIKSDESIGALGNAVYQYLNALEGLAYKYNSGYLHRSYVMWDYGNILAGDKLQAFLRLGDEGNKGVFMELKILRREAQDFMDRFNKIYDPIEKKGFYPKRSKVMPFWWKIGQWLKRNHSRDRRRIEIPNSLIQRDAPSGRP